MREPESLDAVTRERFWVKVNKSGPVPEHCADLGPCWIWESTRIHTGYGHFSVGGRKYIASRLSWIISNGPIPDGLKVLHTCDTPPCVNPRHLFVDTQKANVEDCYAKGRSRFHRHPDLKLQGSECPHAKLNEWQAVGAMAMCLMGMLQVAIATDLGVKHECISKIYRGTRWKHLFQGEWE